MKRKILALMITALVASLLLAGCGPAPTPTQEVIPPTDVVPTEPPAPEGLTVPSNVLLDPALATDKSNREVLPYLYEGLVKADGEEIVPALAVSWTVSEDGLDYIFNLRPGVKFHDGSQLNADAVITNFNRWFDPEDALHGDGAFEVWKNNFLGFKGEATEGKPTSTFDGIEKVNDLTVLVHLSQPVDDLLVKLSDPAFSIVSPDALAAEGFGTSAGKEGGTGAYILGEWSDAGLTFTPFADYWNAEAKGTEDLAIGFSD